jgi:antitoxin PrlF
MGHYPAKMSSKGQITVPAPVRDHLNLREGDIVDFFVPENGRGVRIVARNRSVRDLTGSLDAYIDPAAGPLTQESIDEAVGAELAEKHDRISREWNEWQEFKAWRKRRATEAAE